MTIKLEYAGSIKPTKKLVGILYWADASKYSTLKTSIEDISTNLEDNAALTSAGALSTEGISFAENTEEGETLPDLNGNIVESTEGTSAPSITFQLLQDSEGARRLVYGNIEVDVSGLVTKEYTDENPSPKVLVLHFRKKNVVHRVIIPEATFSSRGDKTLVTDALDAQEVTYNITVPHYTIRGTIDEDQEGS